MKLIGMRLSVLFLGLVQCSSVVVDVDVDVDVLDVDVVRGRGSLPPIYEQTSAYGTIGLNREVERLDLFVVVVAPGSVLALPTSTTSKPKRSSIIIPTNGKRSGCSR